MTGTAKMLIRRPPVYRPPARLPSMRLPSTCLLSTALLAALALAACDRPADAPAPGPAAEAQAPDEPSGSSLPEAAPSATEPPAADSAAPEKPRLRITTLDGGSYDLAAHRGKWVVVNFWATWCTPCLKEMPELSALDGLREHIEVIGLAYEDIEPDAMRAFLAEHPVVYPVAIVDTFDPPADFDTPRGLPTTWLIAPDGSVATRILGPVTAKSLETAIAKAGGPQPGASAPAREPANPAEAAEPGPPSA